MRARRSLEALRVLAVLASASIARAQTAVLTGTVLRDSAGHQLAAAEVLLPDLNRRILANWAGEFKIVQLPAGRHAIVIRHVGFAPLIDTIEVAEGAKVDREFVLAEQPTQLDPVSVKAPEKKYISPALQDFEERRKGGAGHFIDEAEMRKNNERRLIDVIVGHMPGISTYFVKSGGSIMKEFLSSGRKAKNGQCPVTVYVDGVRIYDSAKDIPDQMPDLSRYNTRDYAAVEYYAGGAAVPIRYNATSSGCGVLLLWTRER
jgi:hypothetical protein